MDDFDDEIAKTMEAGQRNLQATNLVKNWCFHAEIVRSPGRGMIEAETGLPIGQMGVQCKFSNKNSMHCWFLEDAAYNFYLTNCKNCEHRTPVGIPNIMNFVGPREEAAKLRNEEREREELQRKQKRIDRHNARAKLRSELSLNETFVLDLLDELDNDEIKSNDPRLEQFASLAPEAFTRKIIDHLLPAALTEYLPYSKPAAKALIRAPLEPDERLLVAVSLVSNYEKIPAAIEIILSSAEKLSAKDLAKVLDSFVFMALGPTPGLGFIDSQPRVLDSAPILSLFQKRHDEICSKIELLIGDQEAVKIKTAAKLILATDCNELLLKHARSIFGKLMRRRILLPKEKKDSELLYYLRRLANKCLKCFPEKSDRIIQSFLSDNDEIGIDEAYRIYSSVMKIRFHEKPEIGLSHKVAFKRLLWAAFDRAENFGDSACQFFLYSGEEFSQLAADHIDDLIGAAAMLSEKFEQAGTAHSLEVSANIFTKLNASNKRNSIVSLQRALIKLAAVGAKYRGREGIEKFLDLYRQLPITQTQMRGNMIVHFPKILSDVESLSLVLSEWYCSLMDNNQLIRASAVEAWEHVPRNLIKNFPSLFFEAFSVLLTDPYVIVHQGAVRSIERNSFPKEMLPLIKKKLSSLIIYYSKNESEKEFLVDCIDAFSFLCLSEEEMKGELGQFLTSILLNLSDSALYHAINRLHYRFKNYPGFAKVALKAIQDDYIRSISIDDCISVIVNAPIDELKKCVPDIKSAFQSFLPFRPEIFVEALSLAAILTKIGDHASARACFHQLKESIPIEIRTLHWRLRAELLATASEIELAIGKKEISVELLDKWNNLKSELETKNEKRAKLRDFPPNIFLED